MQAMGFRVNVWTVNDKNDIAKLIDLGVDAIITNRPDTVRDVLENRRHTAYTHKYTHRRCRTIFRTGAAVFLFQRQSVFHRKPPAISFQQFLSEMCCPVSWLSA